MSDEAQVPQQEPTITFNNKTYLTRALPQDIQELVQIHQEWTGALAVAKRDVFKHEAAIRALLGELEIRFKTIDDAAAAMVPATPAPTAPPSE